jgi:simple sugar transport system permease protein
VKSVTEAPPDTAALPAGSKSQLSGQLLHVATVLGAVCAISAVLLVTLAKVSPATAAKAAYDGSLGSVFSLTETAVRAIPIAFVALGAAIAFRAGVFNVGLDGQMAIGALGAYAVLAAMAGQPPLLVWPLACGAGILAGAAWAAIPAWLALGRGVSDILTTLLMNYIGIGVVTWLTLSDWAYHDPSSIIAQSPEIKTRLEFPVLIHGYRLHAGLFIVIGLFVVTMWYVGTPRGLRDEVQGANPGLARAAGVNVGANRAGLLLVSAAIAGLAGFVQVVGADHLLNPSVTASVGYTGLLVAVLARGRPLPTVIVSFLFAALFTSGDALEGVGVPQPLVLVIEALLVIGWALPRLIGNRSVRRYSGDR